MTIDNNGIIWQFNFYLFMLISVPSTTTGWAGILFSGRPSGHPLIFMVSWYLVEEFQWNLPQIFSTRVDTAESVSRWEINEPTMVDALNAKFKLYSTSNLQLQAKVETYR